jgi:hypothetical protein
MKQEIRLLGHHATVLVILILETKEYILRRNYMEVSILRKSMQ